MDESKMRNVHELTNVQKEMRKKIIKTLDEEKELKEELLKIIPNTNDLITYITEAVKSYDENIKNVNLIMTDDQDRYKDLFKLTKENNMIRFVSNPIYSFINQTYDYNRIIKGENISSDIIGMQFKKETKSVIKYPLFIYTQIITITNNGTIEKSLNIIFYNSKFNNKKYELILDDGFKIIETLLKIQ